MLNFYQPLGFQRTAFRSSMLRGSSLYGSCFAMLATPKVSIGNIMRYKSWSKETSQSFQQQVYIFFEKSSHKKNRLWRRLNTIGQMGPTAFSSSHVLVMS